MPSPITPASLAPGVVLGGYVIETLLGTGGMGEVWRARDPSLLRPVALKVLSPEAAADPSTRARFVREGRAAASLVHPNVVTVYGAGEENGRTYLAMELVLGRTFRLAAPGAAPLERLVWLRDLARALGAVHRAGFVHRDVKPDNVMIATSGLVKLLDFGIAREEATARGATGELGRTGTNQVVGTPRYLAPEQWRGGPIDGRTDQFAWGLMAYEALSGRHPDDASPAFGRVADWRAPATPLHVLVPDLPFGVSAIVARALAVFPDPRFRSMEDVATELEACLAPRERTAFAAALPAPAGGMPTTTEATRREPAAPESGAPPRSHAGVFMSALLAVPLLALAAAGIYLVAQDRFAANATPAMPLPAPSDAGTTPAPSAAAEAPTASASAAKAPRAVPDAGAPRPKAAPATRCGRYTSATVNAADIREAGSKRPAWEAAMAGPMLACARAAPEAYCTGLSWSVAITVEDRGAGAQGFVDTIRVDAPDPTPPHDVGVVRCIARAISAKAPPPANSPRYSGWLVVRFGT